MLDLQHANVTQSSFAAYGSQRRSLPRQKYQSQRPSPSTRDYTRIAHKDNAVRYKVSQRHPTRTLAFWNAGNGAGPESVDVTVERGARNSRRLYAAVQIAAPVHIVWGALTDYERLNTFIPGLTENRCLSRKADGAKLLQVGEQDVAFGAKFRAKVVLDIQEHGAGTPSRLCSNHSGGKSSSPAEEQLYPSPRCPAGQCKDICFSLVEGDFQAFRGIWRMQEGSQGNNSCRLSYALFVRPQIWLPIRLIQNRVENEIKNNLSAVRRHSERLHAGVRGVKQK